MFFISILRNDCLVRCRFISIFFFFFSSRRRHTRCSRDWSSDVCSSDLPDGFQDCDGINLKGTTLLDPKKNSSREKQADEVIRCKQPEPGQRNHNFQNRDRYTTGCGIADQSSWNLQWLCLEFPARHERGAQGDAGDEHHTDPDQARRAPNVLSIASNPLDHMTNMDGAQDRRAVASPRKAPPLDVWGADIREERNRRPDFWNIERAGNYQRSIRMDLWNKCWSRREQYHC